MIRRMQWGSLIGFVITPLLLTALLVFAWPWLGLLTIIPAAIFALAFGFVGAARTNIDWGLVGSALIPLICCGVGWWLGRAGRQLAFG